MAFDTFRPDERLEGSANYNSWKARLMATLEENNLDDLVINAMDEPTSNAGRIAFKKKQAKARRIIYDSIKETMMSTITPLKTAKECFDTLMNIYEKKAPSQKRVLKKRLCTLKMDKDEGVAPFFTKLAHVGDQLYAIGVTVDDDDVVQTVFNGLPSSWETFLATVSGRETQPNFDRLWHNCLEEEGRIQSTANGDKEGNLALTTKTKKFKEPFPQKKKEKKP